MTVRYEIETIRSMAEAAIKGVVDGGNGLAETAVETLIGSDDDENLFDFAMLLVGTARRCMAPAPPYVYVGMQLHGAEHLDDVSPNDDIVLTILSRGFGGKAAADLEGVRMGLADAVRRSCLTEVLLRLAAVAAGLASLDEFGQRRDQ